MNLFENFESFTECIKKFAIPNMDLQKSRDQLESIYQSIQKLRENYDSVIKDAKILCNE